MSTKEKLSSILFGKKGDQLIELTSPIKGQVIDITKVNDQVFSKQILGEGIAILPSEGTVYAPEDGYVKAIYPTNHAIGLVLSNGVQMLIHIGLDTANLEGVGFTSFVKANQKFKKGDILIEFDTGYILGKGYDIITPVIITNDDEFNSVETLNVNELVNTTDIVLNAYK